MAITVQQLFDNYQRDKVNLNDVDDTLFIQWSEYLNKKVYRYVIEADVSRFIARTTFTVSSTPTQASLPADFKTIQQRGCGVFIRTTSGVDLPAPLPLTYFGATTQGYYFEGNSIYFTGFNTTTTLVMRYVPGLTAITTFESTFCLPDEYINVLERLVDKYYAIWDEDQSGQEEFLADQRIQADLSEMLGDIPRGPQVYGLII
jgi:hypothetical protein